MVDSTHAVGAPPAAGTWPDRWNEERRQRRALRRDLMVDIETRCANAMIRRYEGGASPSDARGTVAAQISCQAALTVGCLWRGRRPLWIAEVGTFRLLGALAVWAGLPESKALVAIHAGVREAIATARGDMETGPAPWRTQLGVLDNLKEEAETVADAIAKELLQGMRTPPPSDGDRAGVLVRLLDGRLPDDQLGAAASRAGLDASREHGLVLLVHTGGATAPTEAAARDVEAAIPDAVDLGLSDTRPACRRVVFPVLTHARWIEARTTLHEIATRHGVLAIAPVAAPRLAGLGEACRAIERHLSQVVRGCGYANGIIDPACVGPAYPAEGASPAPAEEWHELALAASAS